MVSWQAKGTNAHKVYVVGFGGIYIPEELKGVQSKASLISLTMSIRTLAFDPTWIYQIIIRALN